jgi:DNA-binding MarR family transcriptional regulator
MKTAEIQKLFRPSGALLEAENTLSHAIESQAVAKTAYNPATLDLLVRVSFSSNQELRGVDLVDQMLKSPGYVSRVIDHAEEVGLVERHADPDDRRAQLIRLTPAGKEALDGFVPHVVDILQRTIYTALEPQEVDTLIDLLKRVSAAAHELLDG